MEKIRLRRAGFTGEAEWDPAVSEWSGTVVEPKEVHLSFHGETPERLEKAFEDMLEARMEFSADMAVAEAPPPAPALYRDPFVGSLAESGEWQKMLGSDYGAFKCLLREAATFDGRKWIDGQEACFIMKEASDMLWNVLMKKSALVCCSVRHLAVVYARAWKIAYGSAFRWEAMA